MKLLISILITMLVLGELGYHVDNISTQQHLGLGLATFLYTLGTLGVLSGNNLIKKSH